MPNVAAWATFDGYTGQIISSGNIGSITRVGPGQYKLCFSSPRSSLDYGVTVSAQRDISSTYPVVTGIGPADQDTVLLLNFDGPNGSTTFKDSSNYNNTIIPVGNTHISTSQSIAGGTSCEFDGSGDSLGTPSAAIFNLGSGNSTVDFWFRMKSLPAGSDKTMYMVSLDGPSTGGVYVNQYGYLEVGFLG